VKQIMEKLQEKKGLEESKPLNQKWISIIPQVP
jgi:hypothetical protein